MSRCISKFATRSFAASRKVSLRPTIRCRAFVVWRAIWGINLHTVNKAYALLRDQGFVTMRGRSGAFIARPSDLSGKDGADETLARELVRLAESYKASGGTRSAFEKCVSSQLDVVFGKKE